MRLSSGVQPRFLLCPARHPHDGRLRIFDGRANGPPTALRTGLDDDDRGSSNIRVAVVPQVVGRVSVPARKRRGEGDVGEDAGRRGRCGATRNTRCAAPFCASDIQRAPPRCAQITHGPAYGHGDGIPDHTDRKGRSVRRVGCKDLHAAVSGTCLAAPVGALCRRVPLARACPRPQLVHRVRPAVHICGHIHEAHGVTEESGVYFVNAASCNVQARRAAEAS